MLFMKTLCPAGKPARPAGVPREALMGRFARNVNIFFSVLAVVLAAVVVAGAYYLYTTGHRQEKAEAGRAITRARALAGRIEREDVAGRYAQQLSTAGKDVQDARTAYSKGLYEDARASAEKALSLLRPVEGDLETPREMPSVKAAAGPLSIESPSGTVEAKAGAELGPGDTLITGGSGRALLVFPNQEEMRLLPGSRVRLDSLRAGSSGSCVEISLQAGSILYRSPDILSAGAGGRIQSKGTEISPAPGSVCLVAQQGGSRTNVQVQSGAATVTNASGSRELKAGVEGVGAVSVAGAFGTNYTLAIPPLESQPMRGRVFKVAPGRRVSVRLEWERALHSGVRVQVSRTPLFSGGLVMDRTVAGGGVTAGGLKAGYYYWRLRSAGGSRDTFWSWPCWFRVLEVPTKTKTPSDWRLSADATVLGDVVLVRGRVHPVVDVTVNDVQVDVDRDGTFSRTFSLSAMGGKNRSVTVCAFDGTGNEKCWSKAF